MNFKSFLKEQQSTYEPLDAEPEKEDEKKKKKKSKKEKYSSSPDPTKAAIAATSSSAATTAGLTGDTGMLSGLYADINEQIKIRDEKKETDTGEEREKERTKTEKERISKEVNNLKVQKLSVQDKINNLLQQKYKLEDITMKDISPKTAKKLEKEKKKSIGAKMALEKPGGSVDAGDA